MDFMLSHSTVVLKSIQHLRTYSSSASEIYCILVMLSLAQLAMEAAVVHWHQWTVTLYGCTCYMSYSSYQYPTAFATPALLDRSVAFACQDIARDLSVCLLSFK